MLPSRLFRCATLLLALTTSAAAQSPTAPAEAVLHRLMPRLAPQFHLTLHPSQPDAFHITGTPGNIHVDASTLPTLLYGVNWYLKYVAHLQVSTNGLQLGPAHLTLPAPPSPITQPALYKIRYALNENADGYTAPYWSNDRWQHEIDILALSGTNAILIERGADLVLYQTFRDAGYSDLAIRRWITQPAHQNWQLMGNMCCFIEPISLDLLHRRAASAQRIIASLRALGITPVLPGYYGIVPADFATLHPGAHVIAQGDWNGFTRPGWIDPRDPSFATLAASFYRHQQALFGDTSIYDMEIFQEGGTTGDVPPGPAAQLVQSALEAAHPNALWFMMAWQNNPLPAVLQALDTSHVLIADIEQGRIPRDHRDQQFRGAGWLFGGLWEFGGRTTLGAPLYDYAVRFPTLAALPGSHITGTALFTEGLDTNPFAFDLYTEMAWHKDPVDLSTWTDAYVLRRYGSPTHDDQPDPHAQRAWQILLHTAYGYRAGDGTAKGTGDADAPQGSLFNAQPSLTTTHAGTWAPHGAHYPLADLEPALTELLQVAPSLRSSETYQYDLVDIARQVMANESRIMLPEINAAYQSGRPRSLRRPHPPLAPPHAAPRQPPRHQPVLPPRPLAQLRSPLVLLARRAPSAQLRRPLHPHHLGRPPRLRSRPPRVRQPRLRRPHLHLLRPPLAPLLPIARTFAGRAAVPLAERAVPHRLVRLRRPLEPQPNHLHPQPHRQPLRRCPGHRHRPQPNPTPTPPITPSS